MVLFQPHRYSRTQALFDDFARAFNDADVLYVLDIYPAGEAAVPGIESRALSERIKSYGHHAVEYAPDTDALVARVATLAKAGDVVVSLGAGNVNRLLAPLASLLDTGAGA